MIADRLFRIFTSLKLTVVLLALGCVLVFWGTVAQVNLGLYKAQDEFFRSFFIYWQPGNSGIRIPIFPAGYTLGWLLILNLFAAHLRYYKRGRTKIGIILIHAGVLLLLVGQFLTDFLSVESIMHLRNGETKSYAESDRAFELAIVDATDPHKDKVVAVPGHVLQKRGEVRHESLPFTIRVSKYFYNSQLARESSPGFEQIQTTAGIGSGLWWRELPHETEMNRRDTPSGIIEFIAPQGSIGTALVSGFLARPQELEFGGRKFRIELRPERYYKPFSLTLLEFRHDRYPGTEIPKNFSSRVRLNRPDTGESREELIYMNSPLRYWGETYYQQSFDKDDQGTVLQVVRNPSWLTPYFSCILVAIGLTVQFMTHLVGFASKRRTPTGNASAAGVESARIDVAGPGELRREDMAGNAPGTNGTSKSDRRTL